MNEAAHPNRSAVHLLVDLIRKDRLATGDRLPSIRQLAGRFGVSPNVVRDGLVEAQSMGLVRIQPREGVFVQTVDPPPSRSAGNGLPEVPGTDEEYNLFHLTEARVLVEEETAARAALRHHAEDLLPLSRALRTMDECGDDLITLIEADERFHLGIARIAGNPVYGMMLRTLLMLTRPFRETLGPSPESRARTRQVHQQIYQAIRQRDAEGARAAMREHLGYHYRLLMDEVEGVGAGKD